MNKAIKVIVDIEQDKLGIRGNFVVTDMLFSDIDNNMYSAQMIKDVKQCMKALKGFTMLTIRMTEGEQFIPNAPEVHSVRFITQYGEIKMSHVNDSKFSIWEVVNEKAIYENIKTFVSNANLMHKASLQSQQA